MLVYNMYVANSFNSFGFNYGILDRINIIMNINYFCNGCGSDLCGFWG